MDGVPPLFCWPEAARGAFQAVLAAIRSPHTKRAYIAAATDFSAWCLGQANSGIDVLSPDALREYVSSCSSRHGPSTVRQRIVCLRRLLNACSEAGATPAGLLEGVCVRRRLKWYAESTAPASRIAGMLQMSSGSSLIDLRDRALVYLLFSSFVPIYALCRLTVGTFLLNRRGAFLVLGPSKYDLQVRCPAGLATALEAYIQTAGIRMEHDGYLFRSIAGASGRLTERPLTQPDVYRIVRRCASRAGIAQKISPREIRAAGLVWFLQSGGGLDVAQELARHGNLRTTLRYAKPGIQRVRKRIAYRLADFGNDWEDDLDDDFAGEDWGDDQDDEETYEED